MFDRRDLLLSASAALLLAQARAQPAPKLIGVLSPYSGADIQATLATFRQGMRDLGYVEGRGFSVVERVADGRNERLPALAAELVKLRVDLILASSTNAVRAAQSATSTIPIVFESVADPVVAGLREQRQSPRAQQ